MLTKSQSQFYVDVSPSFGGGVASVVLLISAGFAVIFRSGPLATSLPFSFVLLVIRCGALRKALQFGSRASVFSFFLIVFFLLCDLAVSL